MRVWIGVVVCSLLFTLSSSAIAAEAHWVGENIEAKFAPGDTSWTACTIMEVGAAKYLVQKRLARSQTAWVTEDQVRNPAKEKAAQEARQELDERREALMREIGA